MPLWDLFVDSIRAALFALSHLYGDSLGAAIVTLSLAVRLALLPLTLRIARRARAMQALVARMRPELERLRARYPRQPERLAREMRRLYARHGYHPVGRLELVGTLVQLPVFGGLYSALSQGLGAGGRFLWIANLSRPDAALIVLAVTLAGAGAAAGANATAPGGRAAVVLSVCVTVLVTALFVSRLAAGLGLYWAASGAVGLAQSLIVRREAAAASRADPAPGA
jgi:YidC/Oxa1 family membrane protein insertase